ncbi:MAG: CoA transferase [Pseudomonadota bacterium]
MQTAIQSALGPGAGAHVTQTGHAELPSCYAVTDLAVRSISAAASELAALTGARNVSVDRRLAALWFDMTLVPSGWALPPTWDAIAGVYKAKDGWIRLHTNAPHHRDAALRALGCAPDKAAVAEAVRGWDKTALEAAIVAEGGAAAAMHSAADWAAHPQGRAVAQEPLIAWTETGHGDTPLALEGLRVLDLTRVLAGPVATRFLAGYGAQVLRIDPPIWAEPGVEPEVTLGKRRAGLDLTCAADRATFEDLLRAADVLVHGYRPGALGGLGFGAAQRQSLSPGLIDVSLCAYGWTGPWAGRRGFDSLVQMSCGIAAEGMARRGADHPVPLPVQALDHATGYLMAAAVLRAVRRRNATGAVQTARLSLARTAELLKASGARDFEGQAISVQPADLSAGTEMTDWGPARRVRFPLSVDGAAPHWPHQAGRLRTGTAAWA